MAGPSGFPAWAGAVTTLVGVPRDLCTVASATGCADVQVYDAEGAVAHAASMAARSAKARTSSSGRDLMPAGTGRLNRSGVSGDSLC